MSSRSSGWTPVPGSVAYQVLRALGPGPGPLSLAGSDALYQATHQLRVAGYIVPERVRGRRAPHWQRTGAGQDALTRADAGLSLNQARVLLLLGPAPQGIRALAHAYRGRGHPPHATHWIYAVLNQLKTAGLALRSGPPFTWVRTPDGDQACAAARRRLGLPQHPPTEAP